MENTDNPISSLVAQTLRECETMAQFALASGLNVPCRLLQRLQVLAAAVRGGDSDPHGLVARRLGECHNRLCALVAPATPRTILLLHNAGAQRGLLGLLGPLPLTRQMMIAALLSLAAMICLTLSPHVNGAEHNSDILIGSGLPLLLNELFLLSAAALGASFSALFIASRYIRAGTFDPRYNISYWIRFVLGLIAGFILGALIDLDSFKDATSVNALARPLLAMIGGFSAAVVYRILNRLAESVESVFRGDISEQVKMEVQAERTRFEADAKYARSHLAYRLATLQRTAGQNDAAMKKGLDAVIRELMDEEVFDEEGRNWRRRCRRSSANACALDAAAAASRTGAGRRRVDAPEESRSSTRTPRHHAATPPPLA
jgi:hypothetical protein